MSKSATAQDVRLALLAREEIALLDVREEAPFAASHPLFAASLPLGRLEMEVLDRIPRLTTRIVVYDDGEGLAQLAADRLIGLGYADVARLEGGLSGWRASGAELFRDVNVPSKAFGELVAARRHTPSLGAPELDALIKRGTDLVILDARRTEEYRTMNIPTSVSVPGGELVYRVAELAPNPETLVVVNCAGRTRSIIGAQSLLNAGIPNRVAALRNGTIGWLLAGLTLESGQDRRAPAVTVEHAARARLNARAVADRAGVGRASADQLRAWLAEADRTTYQFDVRPPDEYAAGHIAGFRSAPGGQLVQETDVWAPVRGARIVLWDSAGARADMTGSWLAQMGWNVHVLDATLDDMPGEQGPGFARRPPAAEWPSITSAELQTWPDGQPPRIVDLAPSPEYLKGHIPGAWLVSRTHLAAGVVALPPSENYAVTSSDGVLAEYAAPEIAALTGARVAWLWGGTGAWRDVGLPLTSGPEHLAAPPIDVYKRPYEGTDNAQTAMQAYLDWEFGLVGQLERDGTHGFFVL
jgi:rhodanese-related sulfurtransferase